LVRSMISWEVIGAAVVAVVMGSSYEVMKSF
jgi:hypothetical protein